MQQLKPAIGHVKVFLIREFAIKRNSMASNLTDAFKCHLPFLIANMNVNSAGET
jgi:hypothetical protein